MKQVRFEDPEEFIADCGVVFDRVLCISSEDNTDEGDPGLQRRLLDTIKKDDVTGFIRVMCCHAEAHNTNFLDGYSVLHVAAKEGATNVMEHVLLSGIIDVNQRSSDFDKTRPLFWAVKTNHCEAVNLLFDHGASELSLNVFDDSAVFTAVYHRQIEVLKLLVSRGCDCNYQRPKIESKIVFPYLAPRYATYAQNWLKESPLVVAMKQNAVEIMRILILGGASFEGPAGEFALLSAISCSGTSNVIGELLNLLAERSASENGSLLWACFQEATRNQNVQAVKQILPYVMSNQQTLEDAFHNAVLSNNIALAACFISAGVKPNAKDFRLAAERCLVEMLEYLLRQQFTLPADTRRNTLCDVFRATSCDRYGLTSLHRGQFQRIAEKEKICFNHSRMLRVSQILLDHGALVDGLSPDSQDGRTALHVSLDAGLVCTSLFLVMAGADPAHVNHNGDTPFFTISQQLLQIDQMHWKKKENLCRLLQGLQIITSSHSKEATKLSVLLTRPDYSATLHKLPDSVQGILNENSFQPMNLMSICRNCVTKAMAPNSHAKVPKLGLPTAIQKCLLFRDLDELLLEMAGRKRKHNNNGVKQLTCVSTEISESSDNEDNEDQAYVAAAVSTKKTKKRSKKQFQCSPQPKCKPKLCLCTV